MAVIVAVGVVTRRCLSVSSALRRHGFAVDMGADLSSGSAVAGQAAPGDANGTAQQSEELVPRRVPRFVATSNALAVLSRVVISLGAVLKGQLPTGEGRLLPCRTVPGVSQ